MYLLLCYVTLLLFYFENMLALKGLIRQVSVAILNLI